MSRARSVPTVTSAVALGVTHVLPASEALMQTSACWRALSAAPHPRCRRWCHPFRRVRPVRANLIRHPCACNKAHIVLSSRSGRDSAR
ncbi:hypothetical protein MAV_0770 [Mycobacterium avium 104]|uniref:Uncharacterized protein n=1 Tax=Mycobacterium avium (strain 104) TaxID=243243 RepID=A0A0H2ZWZ3_MYCA1|nr:hypothetical protein MAV_0770 [Mycobacterium avium 104]